MYTSYILLCIDVRATPNCGFKLIGYVTCECTRHTQLWLRADWLCGRVSVRAGYSFMHAPHPTVASTSTLSIAFPNLTGSLVPLPDFDCDLPQGVEL